jgi:hypothetical protein
MMNVQANLPAAGSASASVGAARSREAKVTDPERPFEARFDDCCKGAKDPVRRQFQKEPDVQAREQRPELADAGLAEGDAESLLVDSVADEKRDGIDDAMLERMLLDDPQMDPRILLQSVPATSGSAAVVEGAKIPVQGGIPAKIAATGRAAVQGDQALQAASNSGARSAAQSQSLIGEGRVSAPLAAAALSTAGPADQPVAGLLSNGQAQQVASSSGAQLAAEPQSLIGEGRVSAPLAAAALSTAGPADQPVAGLLRNGQARPVATNSGAHSAAERQSLIGEGRVSARLAAAPLSTAAPADQPVAGLLRNGQAQPVATNSGAHLAAEPQSFIGEGRVSAPLAAAALSTAAPADKPVAGLLPNGQAQPVASSSGAQLAAEPQSLIGEGRVSAPLAAAPLSTAGPADRPVAGLLPNGQAQPAASSSGAQSAALPNGQLAAKVVEADATTRRLRSSKQPVSARSSEVSGEMPRQAKTAVRAVPATPVVNSPVAPLSSGVASSSSELTAIQSTVSGSRAASFGGEGDPQKGDSNSSASMQTSQQVKMDAAATQKAETVRVFIHRIDSALDALRQETNNVVQLQVSLARGEVIKLRLSLRGAKLKTSIQADNEQIRSLLRSSWPEVSRALAGKGIDAQGFEFEQSTGGGAHKDQAFAGRGDLPWSASTRDAARSDSEARGTTPSVKANERSHQSRFFSRIA